MLHSLLAETLSTCSHSFAEAEGKKTKTKTLKCKNYNAIVSSQKRQWQIKRRIIEVKYFEGWVLPRRLSVLATLGPSALGLEGSLEVSTHTALSLFHACTLSPPTLGPFHTCLSPWNGLFTDLPPTPAHPSAVSQLREAFLKFLHSIGFFVLFLHWGRTLPLFTIVYLCD